MREWGQGTKTSLLTITSLAREGGGQYRSRHHDLPLDHHHCDQTDHYHCDHNDDQMSGGKQCRGKLRAEDGRAFKT